MKTSTAIVLAAAAVAAPTSTMATMAAAPRLMRTSRGDGGKSGVPVNKGRATNRRAKRSNEGIGLGNLRQNNFILKGSNNHNDKKNKGKSPEEKGDSSPEDSLETSTEFMTAPMSMSVSLILHDEPMMAVLPTEQAISEIDDFGLGPDLESMSIAYISNTAATGTGPTEAVVDETVTTTTTAPEGESEEEPAKVVAVEQQLPVESEATQDLTFAQSVSNSSSIRSTVFLASLLGGVLSMMW